MGPASRRSSPSSKVTGSRRSRSKSSIPAFQSVGYSDAKAAPLQVECPRMVVTASYRFGPFTLDTASYRLMRDGEPVALSPKIIDLLLYLVARQSALVPKDELFSALWPDV